jgi:hypothetical protein
MACNRRNTRRICKEYCQLYLGDSSYPARIENISFGGALVHFFCPLPGIHVGDELKMTLKREITFEFNCVVIRVGISNVALRFIDIDVSDAFAHLFRKTYKAKPFLMGF